MPTDEAQGPSICACGRECVRGKYGYYQSHCGDEKCAPRKKRKRLTAFSEKTLGPDWQPGLPRGPR